jgi:hypothetical protein
MLHVPPITWQAAVSGGGTRPRPDRSRDARAFGASRLVGIGERLIGRARGRRRRLHRLDDAVRGKVVVASAHEERREVRVAAITGSVGRATDFTTGFRPVRQDDEERWVGVRGAILSEAGVPPVDLIEFEGAYYVLDGHHRVSVWRDLRVPTIEATVRQLRAVAPASA